MSKEQSTSEAVELEQLLTELEDAMSCQWGDDPTQNAAAKKRASEAKQAIEQYCQERERAARLDELKHIDPTNFWYHGTGDYGLVAHRVDELSLKSKEDES